MFFIIKFMLPFMAILGWSSFFSRRLQIAISPLFFTTTALIGLVEFLFAVVGVLQQGTTLLLVSGVSVFIYTISQDFLQRKVNERSRENLIAIGVFLSFSCLIALFAHGLRFRSIDDYSFWGVMSKYLFFFNQLPTNDHFIYPNFLTYTPGMSCFHYLFYFATEHYSQFTGYLAQGVLLLSALMVLFDARQIRVSLIKIALVYIGLSIGFGAIFARMEVDGYVAAYVFSIMWLIVSRPKHLSFMILFPILFLSIIKEIGLLFAVMCIIASFITAKKNKQTLAWLGVLALGLISVKLVWVMHCHQYGFKSFSQAISLANAMSALNPFNAYYHPVQLLFIKGLFLGKFGHILVWPNSISYIGLIWMWRYLSHSMGKENFEHALTIKRVFLCTLLIYLLMLYWLQAIVFDVGHTFNHLLDFQRYFNMLLIPFTLFTLLLYFQERGVQHCLNWKAPLPVGIALVALTLVISAKIERTLHYYSPKATYALVKQVQNALPSEKDWTLCLQNLPTIAYKLTLTYFFLPNQVLLTNADTLASCDYIMEWPDNKEPTKVTFKTLR